MKKIASTRIPAEQAQAFQTLGLPTIEGAKVVNVVKTATQSPRDWRKTTQSVSPQPNVAAKSAPTQSDEQIALQAAIDKAREQASLEGYTEGLEKGRQSGEKQGYAEGMAKAKQEINAVKVKLEAMLVSLQNPLQAQHNELVDALAHLALNVAEAVLHRELDERRGEIVTVIKAAMAALPAGADNIRVRLSPADHQVLMDEKVAFESDVTLELDNQLKAGDCRVLTRHSVIEYSVSERFKQTVRQLFEHDSALQSRDYQAAPEQAIAVESSSSTEEIPDER